MFHSVQLCFSQVGRRAKPADAHRPNADRFSVAVHEVIVHMPNCPITKYGNEPIARTAGGTRNSSGSRRRRADKSHFSLSTIPGTHFVTSWFQ